MNPVFRRAIAACFGLAGLAVATCGATGCAAPASSSTTPPKANAPDRYVAPAPSASARCVTRDGLPDRACTPGATDPRVTSENIDRTICVAGYTKTVRPPVRMTSVIKRERMDAYDAAGPASAYELDHLIPLELGGAPADGANLWPEPLTGGDGASTKDQVENALHRAVCTHTISLSDAQRAIATDWRTASHGH